MNRLKSSVLVMFAALAMIGAVALNATHVEAQGSAALSISPRKDYNVEPGKEVKDTLLIRNLDREKSLNLSLRVIDFTSNDDGGTPKLLLDANEPETVNSLRSYLQIPTTVIIEPGESKSVPITLLMPANQGPGSYYSAIVYSSSAAEGGNVGLSASGVTLVFAEIPGEVNEKLTLEKLGTYDAEKKRYKLFNMKMPVRISYTLKNEGNVTGRPVGSLMLKNIFGQEKTINDINPNKSLALIDQTRRFDACITLAKEAVDFNGDRQEATTCTDAGLWPGFYTVELQGFYGRNGNNTQEIIGRGHFFYLPAWFVVAVAIALLFIGYHVWRIVRHFRGKGGVKNRAPRIRK